MKKQYRILAINPGSTSTKIACYENEQILCKVNITYTSEELKQFQRLFDQLEYRYAGVRAFMEQNRIMAEELDAVVARGGPTPPVCSGAYIVNDDMIDYFRHCVDIEHASNLGCMLAKQIADPVGIPAYIYDSVGVDEFNNLARISGLKQVQRTSLGHALNMRSVAIKTASLLGIKYTDLNVIVAHLGGGFTISIHEKGQMVDYVMDDEGAFSPERCGGLPGIEWIRLSQKYDLQTLKGFYKGNGGLVSYLGTNSTLEVEKRIREGDKTAETIYRAMAYQIAKSIGSLAPVVCGKLDAIVLTGGLSNSEMLTNWIKEQVTFLAKVIIIPGENELESLVLGVLRVLRGEEEAHEFTYSKNK